MTDRADGPDAGGHPDRDGPVPTEAGESTAATDGEPGAVTAGSEPDAGSGEEVDRGRRRALGAVGWGVAAGLGLSTGAATASHRDEREEGDEADGTVGTAGATGTDELPALALTPPAEATHRAVADGRWDDPATWDAGVPTDGARAYVPAGTAVELAHEDETRLHWVRIDGTVRVDPTVDTRLGAGTVVTGPESRLEVGTADDPVRPDATATIEFLDDGPIDDDRDPERVGRGLVPAGTVRMYGAETTGVLPLSTAPRRGDTTLSVTERPTGWTAGDRLVVAGVSPDRNEDEEVTVAAVEGTTVRIEEPLAYDHVPPASDLRTYVANLDRNVRLQSETDSVPRRGHVMFMDPDVAVSNVGFYDLGRTDKRRPFTDPPNGTPPAAAEVNPRARYACHFHRHGVEGVDRPARVTGCVVWGSPGWGFVNHRSHVRFEGNVTYEVLGAGFVAEAGMEIGTFRDNFALRSTGSGEHPDSRMIDPDLEAPGQIDDFGHAGHGFWLQSPTVSVTGNVAAGHRCNAYTFWTRAIVDEPVPDGQFPDSVRNVRTVPFGNLHGQDRLRVLEGEGGAPAVEGRVQSSRVKIRPFRDNVAFASGGGVTFERNHRISEHYRYDDWSVIENFTAWAIGQFEVTDEGPIGFLDDQGGSAIVHRFGRNLIVRDSRFVGRGEGIGHRVVGNQGYGTMVSVEDTVYENWAVGVDAAHRDKGQYVRCRFDNEVDVRIVGGDVAEGNASSAQDVELRECTFAGETPHVEMVLEPDGDGELSPPQPGHGLANNLYDLFAGLSRTLDGRQLYFDEQAPDYVPIPDAERLSELGFKHHDALSELQEDYQDGLSLAGVVPSDLIGKSNRELMDQYGIAVEGGVMPDDAVDDPRVRGGTLAADPHATVTVDAGRAGSEGGGGTGALSVASDPTAAGGRSLVASDRGRRPDPPADPDAEYTVEVPTAGEYAIWARLYAPTSVPGGKWAATGFWMRVDDGDWIDMRVARRSDTWRWTPVQTAWPDDYSDPLAHETYQLGAGTHTIEVGFAGRGAKLDGVLLTDNRHTVPVGPRPLSAPGRTAGPTDPDSDGRFEDRTGDGSVTYEDVVRLFEEVPEGVDPGAVDFNGNGALDFADVVRLFDDAA